MEALFEIFVYQRIADKLAKLNVAYTPNVTCSLLKSAQSDLFWAGLSVGGPIRGLAMDAK